MSEETEGDVNDGQEPCTSSSCSSSAACTSNCFFSNVDYSDYLKNFPNEIWTEIFKFLSQEERLKDRLVCKFWREKIDQFSSFDINISDNTNEETLERLFSLRVRRCTFSGLKKPFEPRFANCSLLKEITIATNVSSENFETILSACPDLEILRFFTTINSDISFPHPSETGVLHRLKKLREFELGVHFFKKRRTSDRSPTFQALLADESLFFPSLSTLKICFEMNYNEWIALFKFLNRHQRRLTTLRLHSVSLEGMKDFEENGIVGVDLKELVNLKLTKILLNNSSNFNYSRENPCIWEPCILAQNTLEEIELNLRGITMEMTEQIFEKNKATLRSIKLYEVRMPLNNDLALGNINVDGLSFTDMSRLEELVYHPCSTSVIILPQIGHDHRILKEPTFSGVQFLPKSLKKLSFRHFKVATSEFFNIGTNLVELEEISLVELTSRGDCGVSIEAFIALCCGLSKLKRFVIDTQSLNLPKDKYGEYWCWWDEILRYAKTLELYENDEDGNHVFTFGKDQLKGFVKVLKMERDYS